VVAGLTLDRRLRFALTGLSEVSGIAESASSYCCWESGGCLLVGAAGAMLCRCEEEPGISEGNIRQRNPARRKGARSRRSTRKGKSQEWRGGRGRMLASYEKGRCGGRTRKARSFNVKRKAPSRPLCSRVRNRNRGKEPNLRSPRPFTSTAFHNQHMIRHTDFHSGIIQLQPALLARRSSYCSSALLSSRL
jgi:hypothetical protein